MTQPSWHRYERFHHDDVDADLNDEFGAHLALLVDAHVAAGLPRAAAESAARAAFTNANSAMEECRKLSVERLTRQRRREQWAKWYADVRHVLREMRARPASIVMMIVLTAALVAASAVATAFLRATSN